MTTEQQLAFCIRVLRLIALSYRQRIDKRDTPAYEFADEALTFLGEDLHSSSPTENDAVEPIERFKQWRNGRN